MSDNQPKRRGRPPGSGKKKAVKGTRVAKSDQIASEAAPETESGPKPTAPALKYSRKPQDGQNDAENGVIDAEMAENVLESPVEGNPLPKPDTTAVALFEDAPKLPAKDELRPDDDLTEAQKAQFKSMLDDEFPLDERVRMLAKLGRMTGNKTAQVALRAIQMANEISGLTQDTDEEAPSMFNLPDGAAVDIHVKIPEK